MIQNRFWKIFNWNINFCPIDRVLTNFDQFSCTFPGFNTQFCITVLCASRIIFKKFFPRFFWMIIELIIKKSFKKSNFWARLKKNWWIKKIGITWSVEEYFLRLNWRKIWSTSKMIKLRGIKFHKSSKIDWRIDAAFALLVAK